MWWEVTEKYIHKMLDLLHIFGFPMYFDSIFENFDNILIENYSTIVVI